MIRVDKNGHQFLGQGGGVGMGADKINNEPDKGSNPFELIFNEIDDLIYIMNVQGEILMANRALITRLGYSKENLYGMNILDLHPADSNAEVNASLKRVMDGTEQKCGIPLLAQSGEIIQVESRVFKGDFRGTSAFYGICKDVTVLRNREFEVQNSKAQLAALLDNLPFFAWMKDEKGRFIAVNKPFEALIGRPIEDILDKTDYDIWPSSFARKYTEDDQYVMKSGKQLSVEEFIIKRDTLEWVETFKKPIVDAGGNTVGTTGVARIITEQRKLQQELKGQKRFLKSMMDAIPDLIFYKDTASVYLGCNTAFSHKFIGLSEEEIIGKTDLDFVKDKSLAEFFRQKDREMLEAGVPVTNEETITLADGSMVDIETMKTPFFDEEGRVSGLIGVSRDITARKQSERELILARRSAEAASIMKGQFLANMSHEIRTPLNGILGFLNLLEKTHLARAQKDYLKEAITASEILLYLINDILDFSKIEAGRMVLENRKFSLREVVESTVGLIAPKLGNGPVIEVILTKNLPESIVGDPSRLKQVLTNLLSNAVKFTERGSIQLTAERIEQEENGVVLHFRIKDTGIGMRKEEMKFLFEPFTQADATTSRKYGGTGLGLSITRELIHLMGGDVWVDSTFGMGSTFHFVIPFRPVPGPKSETTHEIPKSDFVLQGNPTLGNPPRILLAEDNDINIKLIEVMLENKGLECHVAKDGIEAVTAFRDNDYDLIFMDCQMPGMDGYAATRVIRSEQVPGKRPVIVAMTANAMQGDREKCIEAGMDDYIAKPISQSSFDGILEKYLKVFRDRPAH